MSLDAGDELPDARQDNLVSANHRVCGEWVNDLRASHHHQRRRSHAANARGHRGTALPRAAPPIKATSAKQLSPEEAERESRLRGELEVRKAQEEDAKLNEIAFINRLEEQNKKQEAIDRQ